MDAPDIRLTSHDDKRDASSTAPVRSHDVPESPSSSVGPPELTELGRRIRNLRIERRMTLKQVEKLSGLSATHLSEIERGRTSPTIGALIRIARALGREPSYFIEPEERADIAYLRREDLVSTKVANGVTAETLTLGIPGSEICAYRVRFQHTGPCEWKLKAQETPTDALLMVTSGTVEASIGDLRLQLGQGDAVQAPLTVPHQLKVRAGESAELIVLFTRPITEIGV